MRPHTTAETRLQPLLKLLQRLEDSLRQLKTWKRRLDDQAAGPSGPAAARGPATHPPDTDLPA